MSNSNSLQIPMSLNSIESALSLFESKKQTLKQAFDELQSQSSLLPPNFLSWPEIDSHFTSIQAQLTERFLRLKKFPGQPDPVHPEPSQPEPIKSEPDHPTARNELITFCQNNDGKGLREYMSENLKEREKIWAELVRLLGSSSGEIVLNAVEGFYGDNGDLHRLRKSCLDLLEIFIGVKKNLSDEVKSKAKNLALEWKGKVSLNSNGGNGGGGDSVAAVEVLGLLSLIVAFELEVNDVFSDVDKVVDYFYAIARFKLAPSLACAVGLDDKIKVLVQKLIDNKRSLLALKFIFECGLTNKFQPASILRDHLKECERFTDDTCKDENSSTQLKNEARSKEVGALKSALKYIDERNLEFDYPRLDLEKRMEMLEKQKADNKVTILPPHNRPQQQPKKQQQSKQPQQMKKRQQQKQKKQKLNENKRPRTGVPPAPAAGPSGIADASQQSHLSQAGLYPATRPYGLGSSAPPISSYAGASAGPYGLGGAVMGFPGNSIPVDPHPYIRSGFYDRSATYSGYGFPSQYYSGYHPQ